MEAVADRSRTIVSWFVEMTSRARARSTPLLGPISPAATWPSRLKSPAGAAEPAAARRQGTWSARVRFCACAPALDTRQRSTRAPSGVHRPPASEASEPDCLCLSESTAPTTRDELNRFLHFKYENENESGKAGHENEHKLTEYKKFRKRTNSSGIISNTVGIRKINTEYWP